MIKVSTDKYNEIINNINKLINKYETKNFEIRLRRTTTLDSNSLDCPGGENLIHINVNGKVSPCSWITKVDKNNEFSSYWPESNISECIKKFRVFDDCKKLRKEKYGYCGCIALSHMYNGNFLAKDPLNEILENK